MQEITLSDNLQQIELEINHHKNVAGQSIWEIGRRLNHVKEHDLAHGQFMEWLKKIEIDHTAAKRMMKVAHELPNSATLHHLGTSALYLIATMPDEQKQEQVERIENGDNPTVRELQEVRRQLNKANADNQRLREQNENLAEQAIANLNATETKTITKEVVKEVVPDDYKATKQLNSALLDKNKDLQRKYEDVKSRNDFVEMQVKDLYEQRAEVDEKSAKYDELTRAIEQSKGQLDEYQKSISAYKDVISFLKKGNQFLSNFGGLVYVDVKPALANQQVKSELETFSVMLNSLAREVDSLLSQDNILEGEIL